ncbi:MAG TPA: helix-turn-helix transcriptional regulator [Bryobacteraceae bacterium]|nr:helix-turn-helix transcriptional regulator [Bryobacteraceae bacterium]
MPSQVKTRAGKLPAAMLQDLIGARRRQGWSQAELGQRVGLPQMHISGIETGKVVPRFDTLLDLVRVLEHDLLLVPRDLVPIVQALTRDRRDRHTHGPDEERPLYEPDEDEERPA